METTKRGNPFGIRVSTMKLMWRKMWSFVMMMLRLAVKASSPD